MSKYKNLNLIKYKNNGNSIFLMIDSNGVRDQYFDFFIKKLLQRNFTKNTIDLYSYGVASFIDYLNEYTKIVISKDEAIDGNRLSEMISDFPKFIYSGTHTKDKILKQIAINLNAKPLKSSTEETYTAAVNNYLLISEEYRQRLFEMPENTSGYELIPEEKLFPWIGEKKKISKQERFNINTKNVLSSVVSGGARFKQMSAIKTTRKKTAKEHNVKKEYPLDKTLELINQATSYIDKTLISLLASSGVRTSEALLLTLDDIDYENRSIQIINPREREMKDYNNYFSSEEKNELPFKSRSTKHVFLIKPFDDYFWSYLAKYMQEERNASNQHPFLFTAKNSSEPLIINETKNFTQRFKYLSKKVTGENYSPHSLRHMYISYLVNYFPCGNDVYGLPANRVQKIVGHTNLSSTQVYVHPDLEIHKLQQNAFFYNLEKDRVDIKTEVRKNILLKELEKLESTINKNTGGLS